MTNYEQALHELYVAQQQFEQADADHIDVAVHQLQAAELRVRVALQELKGGEASA